MSETEKSAVLLVEDDESDILLLRRAFLSLRIGNPLSEVRNGEEAIKYLSGSGRYADRNRYPMPVLMLLDLRMPKLSGFEVLEWVKEQHDLRGLIVVVLTALDSVSDVNKAYSLGANSYLVKPDSFERLMEMVKTLGVQWLTAPPSDIDASAARFDQTKA